MFKRFFPSSPAGAVGNDHSSVSKLEEKRLTAQAKAEKKRLKNLERQRVKLGRLLLKQLLADYKAGKRVSRVRPLGPYKDVLTDVHDRINASALELTVELYNRQPWAMEFGSIENLREQLETESVKELFAEFKVKIK